MKYMKLFIIFFICYLNINAQIIPELSKNEMDFGDLAECKIAYDTVIVRNPSASTQSFKLKSGEYIQGPSCFKIINPKIKDLDLPPYDGTNAVIYVVEFNAALAPEGNISGNLFIPTDLPNFPSIQIQLKGAKWSSSYDFTNLDFGTIGVGIQASANLTLHLSSKFNIKIKNITNSLPELIPDLTNFNYSISSNDTTLSIKYNLTLPSASNFKDTILIAIEEPCDTILKIPVSAVSISSNLNYLSSIDIGSLSQCETKDTSIEFNYEGIGEAKINSLGNITGNGNSAALFTATFSQNFPIILNPSSPSSNLVIHYSGDKSFQGVFSINVPINITMDGTDYVISIAISGIVEGYNILIDTNILNFGSTLVNQQVQKKFTITNNGATTVDFLSYQFVSDPSNSLSLIAPFQPFSLAQNENKDINIAFNPQFSNISLDGFIIIYYQFKDCKDSIVISLKGQSLVKHSVDFELKAGRFSPLETSAKIPVSIISNNAIDSLAEKLTIQISFLRDMYFPLRVSNDNGANIISNQILGDFRILKIEVEIPQINDGDTLPHLLFEIDGEVLLGAHTQTPITIDSVEFNDPNLFEIGNIQNDTLYINNCSAGGDRLLQYVNDGPGIIQPFQVQSNTIKFEIHTLEKGNYTLSVYDYLGSKIKEIKFYGEKASIYEFDIPINNQSSSIYFYKMSSPTQSFVGKFIKIN